MSLWNTVFQLFCHYFYGAYIASSCIGSIVLFYVSTFQSLLLLLLLFLLLLLLLLLLFAAAAPSAAHHQHHRQTITLHSVTISGVLDTPQCLAACWLDLLTVAEIKQSHYRPGEAKCVPGS
jgi:hypothetical protein